MNAAGSSNNNNNNNVESLSVPVTAAGSDAISAIPFDSTSYSPQLMKLMADLVKSTDPLDQPSFDSIGYINSLFPDVLSLTSLDPAVAKLNAKVVKLDDNIVKEVRKQRTVSVQGKKDLDDAKNSVTELFGKVKDIKERAEKSEQMVMDITREIKSLDHAKKYLTMSIKILKNLQMQMDDVELLKVAVSKRQFREIGNLLEIVLERQQGFTAHSNAPKIRHLGGVIDKLKEDLTKMIYAEFNRFEIQDQGKPVNPQLGDVCFVVDSLGYHLKDEFVRKFVDGQLLDYRAAYAEPEYRSLDSLASRFNWLQEELQYYDKNYTNIFPHSWRMAELISEEFCIITKLVVAEVLEKTKQMLDVKALIKSMELTVSFEKALSERFRASGLVRSESYASTDDETKDGSEAKFDPKSLDTRYKHHKEKLEEQLQLQQLQQQTDTAGDADRPATVFKGIISRCFDPYLDLYIATEDRNMKQMLETLIAEETWTVPEEDNNNKVLESCTNIILYFNAARKRCSKLTCGQPFFDLYGLFKKYLRQYAQILATRLPIEGQVVALTEDETTKLCIIINTAKYGSSIITTMNEAITKLIDDQFKAKIDLASEKDEYGNLESRGVKILAENLQAQLEPAMNIMRVLPWGDEAAVGEESSYVNQIDQILAREIPICRGALVNNEHFKNLCDLFVASFIPRIIQTIYKLKRISETGAQRLLLDITTLRKVFVMMPTFGLPAGSAPPKFLKFFVKLVDKEIGKATALLRVLQVPANMPDKLVELYHTALPDGTMADFARVLDLKGVRFKEKEDLLAKFQNTIPIGGMRTPGDALKRLIDRVF